MQVTETILMKLLRSGLQREQGAMITAVDTNTWKQVLKLAGRQGVLAIAYDAVQKLPTEIMPPKEIVLRWAVNVDRIERDYEHKYNTLGELSAFYAAHEIPMMVLKGSGLASLYPMPTHRPCGDIDIWLYGKQPQADDLVHRELGIAVCDDVHHHTIFTFKGVMIENHFDFLNCWSHRSNGSLECDLRHYADECGDVLTIGRQSIHLPSPNLNALFLMRHMTTHFAAVEIGLRHLADWAMFLRADGDKVDWPAIRAIYKFQNMHRFADAATALCVEWLGVEQEKAYPYEDNKELQSLILDEILAPAFSETHPDGGLFRAASFKIRRWWANRWKHRLVYRDSLVSSFLWLCWAHVIRPKTIIR